MLAKQRGATWIRRTYIRWNEILHGSVDKSWRNKEQNNVAGVFPRPSHASLSFFLSSAIFTKEYARLSVQMHAN